MIVRHESSNLVVETDSESETDALGAGLARVVEPNLVMGLVGPLGAGKTRLVRALAVALGTDPAEISSPTFVLIHEYDASLTVYHFDTYRLKTAHEFDDLGAADYWTAGGVCLVEWADRVRDRLPSDTWFVMLEPRTPNRRVFVFSGRDDLNVRLSDVLAAELRAGR